MIAEKTRKRDEEPTSRMVFFRSGGELFALGIEAVGEIVVDIDLTPVPLAPLAVVGVANHRGRIFTVLNFGHLSRLHEIHEEGAVIFLYHPEMTVGFAVESILGIESVPSRLLEGSSKPADRGGHPFLAGLLDFEGRIATIVDNRRLAETINLLPEEGMESAVAGSAESSAHGS